MSAFKEYRLRWDGPRSLDDKAVAFLQKRCDGYILVHHTTETENPHYHAYVRTSVSQGNLSNYIKKEFEVSKSDYSCKACMPDRKLEFWAYLFNTKKGNVPTLVASSGIPMLQINSAKEQANTIAKEFETRIKNAKEGKKLTKFDIAELLSKEKFYGVEDLYDAVVKILIKNRMCTSSFVVKDIMETTLRINGDPTMKERLIKYFIIPNT